MTSELLIKEKKGESFNAFVAQWLTFIRCEQWEQHQSSNFEDNCYIRCFMFGLDIIVAKIRDARFKDFHFLIRFEPEIEMRQHKPSLDGFADCIARKLAMLGYQVVRPYDRQVDTRGLHYLTNPDKAVRPWEKVVAEEVMGMPSRQFSFNLQDEAKAS